MIKLCNAMFGAATLAFVCHVKPFQNDNNTFRERHTYNIFSLTSSSN